MKTVALRFAENFSPTCGTISAHEQIIESIGYVWYGKLGARISKKVQDAILCSDCPKILLINSGKPDRYWAFVKGIQNDVPSLNEIPEYYRDRCEEFKTWFMISRFEKAPNNIMSKCTVVSSGNSLGEASKHSMSPYFIIETNEYGLL